MVDAPAGAAPTGATYDALVTKCQREASGLPFLKTENHDTALWVVGAAAAFAIGWNIGQAYPGNAEFAVPLALAATPALVSIGGLFSEWVYSPQKAVWRKKQETQVANCMARSGYKSVDPSVLVTWLPISHSTIETRPTGRDTYSAEKLAKSRSCAATPVATLVSKGPGYEDHRVACTSGPELTIHCEFGNCKIGSEYAAR